MSVVPDSGFSILVYHNIADSPGEAPVLRDSVHLADFERQLSLLKERRFNVIPLPELVSLLKRGGRLPARTVVLTFDDGYRSTFDIAYPRLRSLGFPASIFLATGFIGSRAPFGWLPPDTKEDIIPLDWEDVLRLHLGGMEIGSHTAFHSFLPVLDPKRMEGELISSRRAIVERINVFPASIALPFSYPLAHRNWPSFAADLEAALVRSGYTTCCTLQRSGIVNGPVLFLPRVCIMRDDRAISFLAKASGFYRYTAALQNLFQRFVKKYEVPGGRDPSN